MHTDGNLHKEAGRHLGSHTPEGLPQAGATWETIGRAQGSSCREKTGRGPGSGWLKRISSEDVWSAEDWVHQSPLFQATGHLSRPNLHPTGPHEEDIHTAEGVSGVCVY